MSVSSARTFAAQSNSAAISGNAWLSFFFIFKLPVPASTTYGSLRPGPGSATRQDERPHTGSLMNGNVGTRLLGATRIGNRGPDVPLRVRAQRVPRASGRTHGAAHEAI